MVVDILQFVGGYILFEARRGIRLGFAPALCNGLCKVGEEAGQPQDDRNGQNKPAGDNAVGDTAQGEGQTIRWSAARRGIQGT